MAQIESTDELMETEELSEQEEYKDIPIPTIQDIYIPPTHTVKHIPRRRITLQYLQQIAQAKGGKCLDETYTNTHKSISWSCQFGHKWNTSAGNVMRGSWCPACGGSTREHICRQILEAMFSTSFSKARPDWLINDGTGKNLELDCFSQTLKIAVEVQGEQHIKKIDFLHNTDDDFERQKQRDELKRTRCKQHNITLIELPHNIPTPRIQAFLLDACSQAKVELPVNIPNVDVAKLHTTQNERLQQCHDYAKSRGGVCLSNMFVAKDVVMKWRCSEGHEFEMTVQSGVTQGSWCTVCSNNFRSIGLPELIVIAESHQGKCLSTTYPGSRKSMEWECAKGHQWSTCASRIRQGHWCPRCHVKRVFSLDLLKQIAAEKGGTCLSEKANTSLDYVLLRCARGHEWETKACNVLRNVWCRKCGHEDKPKRKRKQTPDSDQSMKKTKLESKA